MKALIHVLCTCVLAATAGAQSAAAQAPQTPKPGPEHERLGYFVGKWTGRGRDEAGSDGARRKDDDDRQLRVVRGTLQRDLPLGGQTPMGASKSIGILGYSPEEKVYTYYGVDNTNMTMASVPKGTVQGDTWTYNDEGMMGGQKMKTARHHQGALTEAYSFRMETQGPDGKWVTAMESKNTKQ